jgi:hypothetical protein
MGDAVAQEARTSFNAGVKRIGIEGAGSREW